MGLKKFDLSVDYFSCETILIILYILNICIAYKSQHFHVGCSQRKLFKNKFALLSMDVATLLVFTSDISKE